jgi:hypothetical protein
MPALKRRPSTRSTTSRRIASSDKAGGGTAGADTIITPTQLDRAALIHDIGQNNYQLASLSSIVLAQASDRWPFSLAAVSSPLRRVSNEGDRMPPPIKVEL